MKYSLRTALLVMLIVALATYVWAQRKRAEQLALARVALSMELAAFSRTPAFAHRSVVNELSKYSVVPSQEYQQARKHFEKLRNGTVAEETSESDRPRLRAVPAISDDQVRRHDVRLWVPESACLALDIRVGTADWPPVDRPNAEPPTAPRHTNERPPFEPREDWQLRLSPGEHLLQTTWNSVGKATFTVHLDGQLVRQVVYQGTLSNQHKWGALEAYTEDAGMNPESATMLVRNVSPIALQESEPRFSLQCQIVRCAPSNLAPSNQGPSNQGPSNQVQE